MMTIDLPVTSPVFPGEAATKSEALLYFSLSFCALLAFYPQYDPPRPPRWYQFFSEKENTVL